MTFTCIDHFTKICTAHIPATKLIATYISSSCFSSCRYVPEILMQKNNMRIIGDMRMK